MESGADPEPLTVDLLSEVADFSLKDQPIVDGDVVFYPRPETLSKRHNVLSEGPLVMVQRGIYGDCGVGGVVWDAAVVLARLIEKDLLPGIGSVVGKRVVELGSGCAAVGLAAAVHGARSVVLTDEKNTLPSTQANADQNKEVCGECEVTVQEADWRCEGMVAAAASGCDVVMLADCVYDGPAGDTGASVIGALHEALDDAHVPLAIIAYKRQRAGMLELAARFLEALKAEFDVEELPNEALVPIECHEAGIQVITVRVMGSQ